MHRVCLKRESFYFKDFANEKMSCIYYLSSKKMFTERKQVLKEMFMKENKF